MQEFGLRKLNVKDSVGRQNALRRSALYISVRPESQYGECVTQTKHLHLVILPTKERVSNSSFI